MRIAKHVRLDRGLLQLGIVSLTFLLAAVAVNAQQTTECNNDANFGVRTPPLARASRTCSVGASVRTPNKNWNNRIGSIRIY